MHSTEVLWCCGASMTGEGIRSRVCIAERLLSVMAVYLAQRLIVSISSLLHLR